MNGILAENRFPLTKALFFEGMRRVWAERSGKAVRRLLLALGAAWIAFTAYTLRQGGGLLVPAVELLVLVMVALWAAFWLPRSKAGRAYRALERRGTAEAERITRFYADRLEVELDGQRTVIPYADIAQVLTSSHLLILIAADGTGILLDRGSFTHGTENEVLKLIQKGETVS